MPKLTALAASQPPPRCVCGGTLRKVWVERYDLGEIGLDVVLLGKIAGNRCNRCRKVSLPNELVDQATNAAVLTILRLERRLAGREAAFLRHAVLGLDVTNFARWRGRSRASIHRYEQARSLPDHEDFILRGLVLGHLMSSKPRAGRGIDARALREAVKFSLSVSRHNPAPKRLESIEFQVG